MFSIESDNRILHAIDHESKSPHKMLDPVVRVNADSSAVVFATDGRVATVRPVDVWSGDEDRPAPGMYRLPADAIRRGLSRFVAKFSGALVRVVSLTSHGKEKGAGIEADSVVSKNLPSLGSVFPEPDPWRKYATVAVDPDLLYRAMKAAQSANPELVGVVLMVPFDPDLSSDEVQKPAGGPVVIHGSAVDSGASLLMPMVPGISIQDSCRNARMLFKDAG